MAGPIGLGRIPATNIGWQHQLALTILAAGLWLKLGWIGKHRFAPIQLYWLSMKPMFAFVIGLMCERCCGRPCPLPELTPEKATTLVIEHLVNRNPGLVIPFTQGLPPWKLNIVEVYSRAFGKVDREEKYYETFPLVNSPAGVTTIRNRIP